ncbi:MAG: hypothetical protein IPG04_10165 [Polyangiaceae bacterium]|nr:hypothetical protein [Polyangiaceae bacterium]
MAGFDDAPEACLGRDGPGELGPFPTPHMTPLVLPPWATKRLAFNTLARGLLARGSCDLFHWRFETKDDHAEVSGTIARPPRATSSGSPITDPPGERVRVSTADRRAVI